MKRLLSVTAFCAAQVVFAQDQTSGQSQGEAATPNLIKPPQQVLEEITIVGERTFISIRTQIREAEEDMYDLFNELNSDDDFDIVCRYRQRTSHIRRRECEPMFLTRARQANAVMSMAGLREGLDSAGGFAGTSGDFGLANGSQMYMYGLDLLQTERELEERELSNFEALAAEMLRIATENPDYLEALMRVGKLKQTLTDERLKKFGIP